MLERVAIDGVDLQAHAEVRERHRQRRLGHPEHRERRLGVETVRRGGGAERFHGRGVDGLGAVERQAPRRQVEAALAAERTRRERVGEVRARGDRAAVLRDPLEPRAGGGEEVGRRAEHELEARQHRRHQQADEPHVVVQGEPRHRAVLARDPDGFGDRGDVGEDAPVGEHHALRIRGGPARELEDGQTVGIVGRPHELIGGHAGCLGGELVEADEGGVRGRGIEERRELGVDDHDRCVGAVDAPQGLVDELFDRTESHRQRQGDDRATREPDRLQRRDQRARRRPDDRDVRSRLHAARLEHRGHGPGLVVELAPRHPVGVFAAGGRSHERDRPPALRGSFETRGDGSHGGFDSRPTKGLPTGERPSTAPRNSSLSLRLDTRTWYRVQSERNHDGTAEPSPPLYFAGPG